MSCCGKKRNGFDETYSLRNPVYTTAEPPKMWDDIMFEYTGDTSLIVKGNITRLIYRFNRKHERLLIDYRDAAGMMAVPVLRRISTLEDNLKLKS